MLFPRTTLTAAVRNDLKAGRKNVLINGDGVIVQRALASINDDTYSLDRWVVLSDGDGVVTPSRETSDLPSGARSAIKLTVDTANKKFGLLQVVEGKDCKHLISDAASLSAKAKASGIASLRVAILAWVGSEDAVTSDVVSAWGAAGVDPTLATSWAYENTPANISLSTSWAENYEALNASIDTASAKQVAAFIWIDDTDASISDTLLITDVQIEKGAVATSFEQRSMAEELNLCHRYFFTNGADSKFWYYSAFLGSSASGNKFSFTLPSEMRVNPTVTKISDTAFINVTSLAVLAESRSSVSAQPTITTPDSHTRYGFDFEADAEL